ncbi:GntR family transcriptional regulator [Citreicella sp. C3M06]|uniref:FadR/GntR family transcriptional regulator n=1 Tax=Citreicella sp. C3M06 TaxID=2841564 RepID=UPI001C092A85|nr:GntR family transcriptional regulator [Citreicella sp. C3M06]MBU2962131.1 GntR family transcriptional regulator [Citreicella sp. C3M06]
MSTATPSKPDRSSAIASALRTAIIEGRLMVGDRLPSETELAEQFAVSRSTVREALKRLAAQSLIRTRRGATGGAFVNHLSYDAAHAQQITTGVLLLSMNAIGFDVACEARFAMERACAPLACARRSEDHLQAMQAEIARQSDPALSDEAFCASDVAFHRALVDAAGNPVLSWQLSGAIEAMQPLMNMITFTARDRARIVALHSRIAATVRSMEAAACDAALRDLESYTVEVHAAVMARRALTARAT